MDTKSSYHVFTDYYDAIVRGEWYSLKNEVAMLVKFIQKYSDWKAHSILEVACGTWVVAKKLVKMGYDVLGMDISEEMISVAQDNIWEDRCILWDMRDFDLSKKFDVILCNYNSICHLVCFKDWQKFFLKVYEHLKEEWLFIFDVMTIYEYENITRDFSSFYNFIDTETERKDVVCLSMDKEEFIIKDVHLLSEKKMYYYKRIIKIFRQLDWDNYNLIEEEIAVNSYYIEDIIKELNDFWFKLLKLEDFHKWEVDSESGRVYFVCRKV